MVVPTMGSRPGREEIGGIGVTRATMRGLAEHAGMTETLSQVEAVLEVISPDGARKYVRISQTPFLIGRGSETGNHLQLTDRRISRNCGAIVMEANHYYIEDRGQRRGLLRERGEGGEPGAERRRRNHVWAGRFLPDDVPVSYRNFGRVDSAIVDAHRSHDERGIDGRRAAEIEFAAGSYFPAALAIAAGFRAGKNDRPRGGSNGCGSRLAAGSGRGQNGKHEGAAGAANGGQRLPPESITPSGTAIQLAIKQQSPVITEDLAQAEMNLQAAASIVSQGLRAVVVIPLYATSRASSEGSAVNMRRGEFLGVLYLDSKRPTAFTKLDRQILDALAADAASILDNARLVETRTRTAEVGTGNRHRARHPAGVVAEEFSGLSAPGRVWALIFPACRWEGIITMCSRSTISGQRFCWPT